MSAAAILANAKVFPPLTASVQAGASASDSGNSHGFGSNTCTPGGGSGSYSYSWHETDDAAAAWALSTPMSQSTGISVSSAPPFVVTAASLTCTVTDTVTHRTVTSSAATYQFEYIPSF